MVILIKVARSILRIYLSMSLMLPAYQVQIWFIFHTFLVKQISIKINLISASNHLNAIVYTFNEAVEVARNLGTI